MRIDVSEIKSFRECGRKWQLTSRNRYHLKSLAPNENFLFGTLFHEALHSMYAGANPDSVLERTLKELTDPAQIRVMSNMLIGYATEILPEDLRNYRVLDIEHGFRFTPDELEHLRVNKVNPETGEVTQEPVELCGSIDMIALKLDDNTIWGFEHKTCKQFREATYARLDEQPRIYDIALRRWIVEKNFERFAQDPYLEPYKPGGILINQVKKTVKVFNHDRIVCAYNDKERDNFMRSIGTTCYHMVVDGDELSAPNAGQLKCQMCDCKNICEHYGYNDIYLEDILAEFGEEFAVREVDHLDEKVERTLEE